ncbi:collagen alpha-2(IV) chain [Eptesicus fuscus]|uniref:collagen alpha-2(IV) chain n=1 Tax=Eptesicus fuscus TaxID=29078 RepID=UPI002403D524|nr:collagen alpha-2(IV) chain [Eptesicus fuscus]
MPGRCVGPSRSGRVARRPRGKKWTGTSRGRGGRRRARASVWGTRCVSAEKPQGCRQPCGGRRAAETAEGPGANEASRTPGTAGSTEAAKDPGAVLVNGAAGEPQVVGPAGSVWVTGTGDEEQPAYRSPRGCERKGRPGSMGHESILELWLKVQAMRAASGCGEGSRVELHPVPAGEGPVERGVPGRASWVETSRRGLTGPWVEGQVRAVPQASGGPTATGLRAGCERLSGLRGLGQAVRLPPGGVPRAAETSSGIAPHLLGRGQAVGVPGTVEEIGYEVAPGPWGKGPIMGVPGAVGWPEAVEGEVGCGGTPGLWERGQSGQVPGALVQEAVSGDTLWGRGQAVEVPRAVEETPSVGAPGLWPRRQALEEIGPGGIPDLWVSRQPVGVPCAVEEETRCGGDPGFRERGQAVWVETGSAGDPGSWEVAQTAEVSGPEEQEAGPGGAPGLWRVGQALGVPRALGKEAGWGSVPGLWGTDQPGGVAQAGVVPGAIGEQPRFGGIPGLWDRQQALGVPLADAVPGVVGEETCCENVLSLWERRQAVGEQEALVPTALGVPGSVGQEAGYRDVSCLCRRRQAAGLSETAGMSEASGVPKHRCAPTGVPAALGVPGSGRVPAAVWVSGPICPEISSRDVLNLWESVHTAGTPLAPGVPVASEELLAVRENAGSAAFPRLWGRRPVPGLPVTDRVAVAPEVPGLAGEETGSGGVPRSWGRRQSAGVPVAVEVPAAPRVPCPLGVETGSGGFSPLPGRRQTAGVPVTVGLPGPVEEETLSGGLSGLSGRRRTAEMPVAAGVSMAVGVPTAAGASGLVVGDTSAGDVTGAWGRRLAMERPTAARASGPVGRETGSEGVPGLWRRPTTVVPEAVRVPLSLGVLAGVGVPMAGHVPAAVWVSGSTGEETTAAGSGLTLVTRQSARGPGASGEQTGGGSILGLAGRSQAAGVSYTHGRGTRSWSCPGSVGEETDCENVSGTRTTREVNEAVEVSSVSREEMGIGRFRDHPQQRGRRQPGGVSGMRVRGDNLGENCVGEDRLRGAFL